MSSQKAKDCHSITIGGKNTWDDWHLIPSSRPLFNPPPVKTSYVEIPGGDGILDLTTAMTGKPMYSNRTGSWEFYVENGYKGWTVLYSEIMHHLHGEKMQAVLDDDIAYYYEGRFSVNQWRSDPAQSLIVIDYNVAPYKMRSSLSNKWLWDPFNFDEDVIRTYENLPIKGKATIDVFGDEMDTIPIITCSYPMILTFKGNDYYLDTGSNKITDIVVSEGTNSMTFTGTGEVSISMVGGSL